MLCKYTADVVPEALASAAIVDILERGDLAEWRPIAVSIAAQPHGPLAERVVRLVDAYPMYGTSPLWRAWIERCRARAEGRRQCDAGAMDLADLRRQKGLTQVELAGRIGISQSDLSKLEHRRDVRVSTLKTCAEAMGARFRMAFVFPDQEIDVEIG